MTHPVSETSPSVRQPRRHRTLFRVLFAIAALLLILVIAALIVGNILLHRAGPILKAKVVETLSTRFDSRVELDQFHASFFQGVQVSGSGLKLFPNHLDMNEPMFQVDRFSFHAYDWRQLLHTPMVINRVQVEGLHIHLPPKQQRSNISQTTNSQKPGEDKSHGKIRILVNEIDVERADLVIENGKPGKVPLDFVIQKVRLNSVGQGRPMRFHATLINPRPTGNIDSSGDFGPFNEKSPGDTPVSGQYTFRNADLSTIKGIGGILSSDGRYQGQLNRIVVDGTTTTPDFHLDMAQRPVPLNTEFHAIVDGTNGDTYLQPVDAWLLSTHIIARGDVVHTAGIPGRDVRLDVTVDPGRIQDMLQLAVKQQPALLTGDMKVHTKFDLSPGQAAVIDRLRLDGSFELTVAHFASDKIQGRIDELSLRGQGKPDQANKENSAAKNGNTQGDTPANIAADMRGNFTFAAGKLNLPDINFVVPGAVIAMQGVYGINGQTLDFSGTARLDAHVSQMVTGWKSLLLKPVDPFFAKDGAGTQVPIKVGGTASKPDIGLNFKH